MKKNNITYESTENFDEEENGFLDYIADINDEMKILHKSNIDFSILSR